MSGLSRLVAGVAALAAMSLCLTGAVLATSVKSELAGGSRGKTFALECAHEALAGIELRQDDSVHRVQLICAKPTAAGDLDPPHLFDGAAKGDRVGPKKTIMCPENYGIYSLTVIDDGDGVLDVALNCKDVTEGTVTEVDTGWDIDHGGGGAPAGTNLNYLTCDDGSYGIGLHGRVDGSLTALGIICSPDILVASKDNGTGDGGNGDAADGGNGGNGDNATPPPPPPQNTKWAAFAKGNGNTWGFAIHRNTEAKAQADALNGCGGNNNNCQVFWTTQESCVAFAMSPAPGFFYAAGGGPRQDDAENNAIKFCQSGDAPANSCRVQMAQCQ